MAAVAAIEDLVLELALCCGRILAGRTTQLIQSLVMKGQSRRMPGWGDKIAVYSRGGVFFQAARLSPSLRQRDRRAISSSDEY